MPADAAGGTDAAEATAFVLHCYADPGVGEMHFSTLSGELILTAPSEAYDFVSRCFYPKVDVPEDPVTGRAHTYLAPVWASKLGKTVFRARQISARGGSVGVRLAGERVFLTGQVQPFLVGEIPFDL